MLFRILVILQQAYKVAMESSERKYGPLVASKSNVVQIQAVSIPYPELMASVLGLCQQKPECEQYDTLFWSDSVDAWD